MSRSETMCPSCGQRMLLRFGEPFPPKQADILDAIYDATKGRGGIDIGSLITCFYPNTRRALASQRLRSNITKINQRLESTLFEIVGPGKGNGAPTTLYRLLQRRWPT